MNVYQYAILLAMFGMLLIPLYKNERVMVIVIWTIAMLMRFF